MSCLKQYTLLWLIRRGAPLCRRHIGARSRRDRFVVNPTLKCRRHLVWGQCPEYTIIEPWRGSVVKFNAFSGQFTSVSKLFCLKLVFFIIRSIKVLKLIYFLSQRRYITSATYSSKQRFQNFHCKDTTSNTPLSIPFIFFNINHLIFHIH